VERTKTCASNTELPSRYLGLSGAYCLVGVGNLAAQEEHLRRASVRAGEVSTHHGSPRLIRELTFSCNRPSAMSMLVRFFPVPLMNSSSNTRTCSGRKLPFFLQVFVRHLQLMLQPIAMPVPLRHLPVDPRDLADCLAGLPRGGGPAAPCSLRRRRRLFMTEESKGKVTN